MSVDAELGEPDGCPTPLKRRHRSRAAARRFQRRQEIPDKDRLWPYLCTCGAWHLTHQTPDEQKRVAAWIAKVSAPTPGRQQNTS